MISILTSFCLFKHILMPLKLSHRMIWSNIQLLSSTLKDSNTSSQRSAWVLSEVTSLCAWHRWVSSSFHLLMVKGLLCDNFIPNCPLRLATEIMGEPSRWEFLHWLKTSVSHTFCLKENCTRREKKGFYTSLIIKLLKTVANLSLNLDPSAFCAFPTVLCPMSYLAGPLDC